MKEFDLACMPLPRPRFWFAQNLTGPLLAPQDPRYSDSLRCAFTGPCIMIRSFKGKLKFYSDRSLAGYFYQRLKIIGTRAAYAVLVLLIRSGFTVSAHEHNFWAVAR